MSKVVDVEYDAAANVLRLAEPLAGVEDHAKMRVVLETPVPAPAGDDDPRPWMKFAGILSREAGEDLARAVEEMFPTEK